MRRSALGVLAVLLATAGSAHADDPNRWSGWVSPTDGQSNGLDISMVTATTNACEGKKKPWITLAPRYRSRYQERIAGKLQIDHETVDGARTDVAEFDLQPGETKIMSAAAFCHDSKKSLAFVIKELRFPERDAETARIAAQKAAAEKAAAEKAAAQKAANEKAAAEQAAVEAAKREEAKKEAERLAKANEGTRERDARKLREGQQEADLSKMTSEEAKRYREQRAAEAGLEASKNTPADDTALKKQLRRGELNLFVPLGFVSTNYGMGSEGHFSYGVRAQLRLFTWLKAIESPGKPLSGTGFEVALGGGISRTSDLGSQTSSSKTNLAGGQAHARFWYGSFGAGVFGDWTRYSHTDGSGANETFDLFALGPELAFGLVASRSLAIEASGRAGAVASGSGLKASTSDDYYLSASVIAELDRFYGGAFATRTLTTGGIDSGWTAMGVFGLRLPF